MDSNLLMFLCGLGVSLAIVFIFRKQLRTRRNAMINFFKKDKDNGTEE